MRVKCRLKGLLIFLLYFKQGKIGEMGPQGPPGPPGPEVGHKYDYIEYLDILLCTVNLILDAEDFSVVMFMTNKSCFAFWLFMHTRRTIYVSFSSLRESQVNKFRFGYLGTSLQAASSKFWKWCPLWWSCTLTQDVGPRREIGAFPSKFTSNQYQEHFILYGYKSVVQLMIHPVGFKTPLSSCYLYKCQPVFET